MKRERLPSSLYRYSRFVLFAAIGGWGFWYVCNHPAEIASIEAVSISRLLLVLGLSVVKLASMGLFTRITVAGLGVDLGFLEWFGLGAVSAMGNYLTPFRGGAALRAVYLKSKHDLPYALFISTLTILYILTFTTSAAVGFMASVGQYVSTGLIDSRLITLFSLLLLSPPLLLWLTKLILRPSIRSEDRDPIAVPEHHRTAAWVASKIRGTREYLHRIAVGWQVIASQPARLISLAATSLVNTGVTVLMIRCSFAALGAQLPWIESLILGCVFILSAMIPISPSGLGLADMVLVVVSQGLVGTSPPAVLSAGLNRTAMVLTSLALGIPASYLLGGNLVRPGLRHRRKDAHRLE